MYIGGYVGGTWASTSLRRTDNLFLTPNSVSSAGVVGGLLGGFNYQFNNIVLGLEEEVGVSGQSGRGSGFDGVVGVGLGPLADSTAISQASWNGRLRLRAGLALGNALVYAAGGFSADTQKVAMSEPANLLVGTATNPSIKPRLVRRGWNLGAGVEYAFNPNWIARAEYIYDNYGSQRYAFNSFGNWSDRRVSSTSSTVRAALEYKFSTPLSAVVAKY